MRTYGDRNLDSVILLAIIPLHTALKRRFSTAADAPKAEPRHAQMGEISLEPALFLHQFNTLGKCGLVQFVGMLPIVWLTRHVIEVSIRTDPVPTAIQITAQILLGVVLSPEGLIFSRGRR